MLFLAVEARSPSWVGTRSSAELRLESEQRRFTVLRDVFGESCPQGFASKGLPPREAMPAKKGSGAPMGPNADALLPGPGAPEGLRSRQVSESRHPIRIYECHEHGGSPPQDGSARATAIGTVARNTDGIRCAGSSFQPHTTAGMRSDVATVALCDRRPLPVSTPGAQLLETTREHFTRE